MSKLQTRTVREPLFHLSKRPAMSAPVAWLIRLLALVLGMAAVSLIAFLMLDELRANPKEEFVNFYRCFIDGIWIKGKPFFENRRIWSFMGTTAKLLCIALAITPAFKMRFWNTGAEGQTLMGILGAIFVVVAFVPRGSRPNIEIPIWALHLMMLGSAVIFSIIWAVIPAIFKALFNTNETLFTLMMNYVAMSIISIMVHIWTGGGKGGTSLNFTFDSLSVNIGQQPNINTNAAIVFAVLIFACILFVYLKYTKHGYEISVVGESVRTAQYSGINVKKVIIRTMIISGALCGVAGYIYAEMNQSITTADVGGNGFTAIMVSWLAKFNPLGMVVTAALISLLDKGSGEITEMFDVPEAFPKVFIGIILFFIIGCEFFINYRLVFRKREKSLKGASVK